MGLRALIRGFDDHLTGDRAMRKVREEHDEWARTVQKGAPYYTALPALGEDLVNAGRISRPLHGAFVFDRRSMVGPLTGQWLVRGGNTTSWGLWKQLGPLTLEKQWTHQDQDLYDLQRDLEIERGMGRQASDLAWQKFQASPEYRAHAARVGRAYPATVAALAA
ncbi:hypothetical protein [Kitasatospora sp. NPDC086791]|uniref:hypothetical protein n=1 Tax=Kitasatospora sp. NPDC086791 TaxID=3155178 RepID=UPI00341998C6